METTTHPTRTFRTFELFDIVWSDGARWTGFDTADEAESWMRGAVRTGEVVRRTWEVEVTSANARLLQPGCGDRVIKP